MPDADPRDLPEWLQREADDDREKKRWAMAIGLVWLAAVGMGLWAAFGGGDG